MRTKLLLLVCALVFFLGFLFRSARQTTPAKTQRGHSAVSIPSASIPIAQASNASSSTQYFSANVELKVLADFQQWAENYATAIPSQKAFLFADGLSLAAERREILAELIESDPAEALRQAVPMRLRAQLPPEIVALLEERVSGRGEYSVLAALPMPGAAKTVRPIERFARLSGQTYQAFVYGRRLSQTTRTDIPLHGVAIDGKLALHEDPVRPLEPGETPDPQLAVANPDEICAISGLPSGRAAVAQVGNEIVYLCCGSHIAAYNEQMIKADDAQGRWLQSDWPLGIKTVLFMRLNFPDDLSEPISVADAAVLMNTVSNWYDQVSYHITGLNATVTPLLTLPRTKSSYQSAGDYFGLLADARAVAKTNGFDTAHFDLDCVYNQPTFASDLAVIADKGIWLQRNDMGVACHEFGHNYGLWHANYWNATNDTIIGPGTHEEYGNITDMMGNAANGSYLHFNAYHKNRLGWLPDANVAMITNSGLYRIYAFDTPTLSSNLFYALKVNKDERDYWGELRSRFIFNQNFLNGIILNWSPWHQSDGGTHLLDATPGSPQGKDDCPVLLGRTFSDPFAGIHLTPVRVNTNTVPLSIDVVANLGSFPGNNRPTVSLSASATSVGTGVPVTFTATASDADGDSLAYFWEFGDQLGQLGTNGPVAIKRWTASGEFVVRCTVSDMKGGTASAMVLITVGSPPLYRISGRILNGPAPLEGARVSTSGTSGYEGVSGYTDRNGDYIITAVSPVTYTLVANKPGWLFAPANFSNPVTVGGSVSNLNFSATPATYNFNGRVQYLSQIVPGVTVTVGGTNSTVTDTNGYYSFSSLLAGAYDVTATKPNWELRPQNWTSPIVIDWQDATDKDFERPYYIVSGIVSNLTGGPIVSFGDTNRLSLSVGYAANGNWYYHLFVPRGQWTLFATQPGNTISPANFTNPIVINLTPDQDVNYSFNFRSTIGGTYAISGNISEPGRSVTGARVSAGNFSGLSDTVGNYVLTGLSNGNYQIIAALPEYAFIPATRNVTLSGSDMAGQDFAARLIFWLTQMHATNAGFAFRLSGGSNRVFRLESSTNLAAWATLATVTNAIGQLDFLDARPRIASRFYRAAVLP